MCIFYTKYMHKIPISNDDQLIRSKYRAYQTHLTRNTIFKQLHFGTIILVQCKGRFIHSSVPVHRARVPVPVCPRILPVPLYPCAGARVPVPRHYILYYGGYKLDRWSSLCVSLPYYTRTFTIYQAWTYRRTQ